MERLAIQLLYATTTSVAEGEDKGKKVEDNTAPQGYLK